MGSTGTQAFVVLLSRVGRVCGAQLGADREVQLGVGRWEGLERKHPEEAVHLEPAWERGLRRSG